MAKRKRRAFTKEFKAQAVRIVRESGKAISAVARELDLTETALRSWVRQAEIDAGRGAPGALTTEEREELGRLRRENRSEEHTSELQSRLQLVCRLLLEKKKKKKQIRHTPISARNTSHKTAL